MEFVESKHEPVGPKIVCFELTRSIEMLKPHQQGGGPPNCLMFPQRGCNETLELLCCFRFFDVIRGGPFICHLQHKTCVLLLIDKIVQGF